MFRKIFLNHRIVIIVLGTIILGFGLVLYRQSQQLIEERLRASTWCYIPFTPFLKLEFNKDGSFIRQFTIPEGNFATRSTDNGTWSVYEEESKSWIHVTYDDLPEEDILIRTYIGRYLRLEGNFKGFGNSVNLYRCEQLTTWFTLSTAKDK